MASLSMHDKCEYPRLTHRIRDCSRGLWTHIQRIPPPRRSPEQPDPGPRADPEAPSWATFCPGEHAVAHAAGGPAGLGSPWHDACTPSCMP